MKKTITGKMLYTGIESITNFKMEIEDGIIMSIGKAGEGASLTCDYIIPGLIDSHCHLMLDPDLKSQEFEKPRGASKAIVSGYKHALDMLLSGVVACRDLGSIKGYTLGLKDAIEQGVLPGPRIISAGQSISVTGGHGYAMSLECDGTDTIAKGVKTVVKEGADLVKLMASGGVNSPGQEPGPPELTLDEMLVATETAHAFGKKVAVHAHGYTAIKRAVTAGVDSIEHGVYLKEDLFDEMIKKDIYLVPTLSAPYYAVAEGLKENPGHPDHLESKAVLKRHRDISLSAFKHGVKIAMGTDVGTPYNLFSQGPYELVLMVEAGFTAEEAITCATVNSAALLGLKDMGALEVGKEANFLNLKDNPLEHIETVMAVKGVYLKGELAKVR